MGVTGSSLDPNYIPNTSVVRKDDSLYVSQSDKLLASGDYIQKFYVPIGSINPANFLTKGNYVTTDQMENYVLQTNKATYNSTSKFDNTKWVSPGYLSAAVNNVPALTVTTNTVADALSRDNTFVTSTAPVELQSNPYLHRGIVTAINNTRNTGHAPFFNKLLNDTSFQTSTIQTAATNTSYHRYVAPRVYNSVADALSTQTSLTRPITTTHSVQSLMRTGAINNINTTRFNTKLATNIAPEATFVNDVSGIFINNYPHKLVTGFGDLELESKLRDGKKMMWCANGVCSMPSNHSLNIHDKFIATTEGNVLVNTKVNIPQIHLKPVTNINGSVITSNGQIQFRDKVNVTNNVTLQKLIIKDTQQDHDIGKGLQDMKTPLPGLQTKLLDAERIIRKIIPHIVPSEVEDARIKYMNSQLQSYDSCMRGVKGTFCHNYAWNRMNASQRTSYNQLVNAGKDSSSSGYDTLFLDCYIWEPVDDAPCRSHIAPIATELEHDKYINSILRENEMDPLFGYLIF